ncbi:zinc finger CCHC domain-containing protein 14 [Dasypus novemcinctus]|uniref:zinc finger CCHC domain-containing protein 14 n=1 Tax=Dasypus novemcinctus TaxID=9361 RepID=UPI00265EE21A|nr:zinc finger CCHC domain-containing protein 14 [Dasypus novemcinctus]
MVEKRGPLQRDGVYRWFAELPSPQRVEFLCGLLDLCIPLELRFLGSCLEDLARKDYHSLRDSEIKANNPADLGSLTNLTDEVVRSKLLVSLALLGSEQREAAGVLYRTLTHIDSIIHNYGLQLNEGRTGDEFLLLFTMASNHPAFSFHQKQVLRQELTQIQSSLSGGRSAPTCPACHKMAPRAEAPVSSVSNSLENALHTSAHSIEESLPKRPLGKPSKVSVEKIDLKGLSHKKNERNVECSFEVLWSDSSVTSVTRSSSEVTEFISKLSQLHPEDNVDKFVSCSAGPDVFYVERNHADLDADLRYLASLPSHVLKNDHIKKFFSTSSPTQQLQSPSPGNPALSKVGTVSGMSGRPVCGVAGIPSSPSSAQHHLPHAAGAAAALPHCSHSGGGGSPLAFRTPMDAPPALLMSSSLQAPQTQEQNGILDWLRKLRLHKYYPVFKQLTMEKFLSLTEEDLNKFESLTMGAKKKLKTQLELEKEKSEKRCLNPSVPPGPGSGVARVPPTSHVGPLQAVRGSRAAELRVDVEQPPPQMPREGSSSESSSSSSSPMGAQAREESSDSAEENDRRAETHARAAEKEKPVVLLTHFTSGSARPTAQVLPVQNEAGSTLPGHHPPPPQVAAAAPHVAPIRMLNSAHKAERGSSDVKLLSSSLHSLLSLEERNKGSGPRSSVKVEKSLGNPRLDVLPTPSAHQPLQVLSGVPESSSMSPTVSFGPRAKAVHAATLDRVMKASQQQPTLAVDASTAAAGAASTVFHVARPPIKLLVSSSVPADSAISGQTSCSNNVQISVPPAVINPRTALYTANTKVAFSAVGSVPVGPLQGGFCASSSTASSSSHLNTSFANLANVTSCPAPSSSPALSSVPENTFYSSGGSGATGNIPASSQSHHHHHHHQQPPGPQQPPPPPGCIVCTSCGCSGSCGSGGLTVSYASYFQHPFSGPSVFSFPFLPLGPVCSSGYVGPQQYSGSAFPLVHSPYSSNLTPDAVLSGQSSFAVPPMQSFMAGAAGVYQAQGLGGGSGSSGHKKSGHLSCYNCGAAGHRAQDCKQPPMDFNRPGTFRLKYAPPAESLDSTD